MVLLRKRRVYCLCAFACVVLVPIYLFYSSIGFEQALIADSEATLDFDLSKDLLAFLHIQKTGGSDFDRNIVHHLLTYNEIDEKWEQSCRPTKKPTLRPNQKLKYKKVYCPRLMTDFSANDFLNNWYFSRQTFGWYCGLHVDFTTLRSCLTRLRLDNGFLRKFHYITIIRDPVKRFLSEWNHVTRGSHAWNRSVNVCNKENLLSTCYPDRAVTSITLDEFMSCENNMANNRQTRMLADYSFTDEHCSLFKDKANLLENAKMVLSSLTYFALNEYQELSQELFERTFQKKFKFNVKLKQSENETATNLVKDLDRNVLKKIVELNDLDLNLYVFAKELFFKRLNFLRKSY